MSVRAHHRGVGAQVSVSRHFQPKASLSVGWTRQKTEPLPRSWAPTMAAFSLRAIVPSGGTQVYISLCLHGRVSCTYFLRTGFHKDTNTSQRISGDICSTYSRGLLAVWRPHTAWLPISALLQDLQQILSSLLACILTCQIGIMVIIPATRCYEDWSPQQSAWRIKIPQ